jgi:ABC-type glycerol-3-phosphate transport system substrate-binding protein
MKRITATFAAMLIFALLLASCSNAGVSESPAAESSSPTAAAETELTISENNITNFLNSISLTNFKNTSKEDIIDILLEYNTPNSEEKTEEPQKSQEKTVKSQEKRPSIVIIFDEFQKYSTKFEKRILT